MNVAQTQPFPELTSDYYTIIVTRAPVQLKPGLSNSRIYGAENPESGKTLVRSAPHGSLSFRIVAARIPHRLPPICVSFLIAVRRPPSAVRRPFLSPHPRQRLPSLLPPHRRSAVCRRLAVPSASANLLSIAVDVVLSVAVDVDVVVALSSSSSPASPLPRLASPLLPRHLRPLLLCPAISLFFCNRATLTVSLLFCDRSLLLPPLRSKPPPLPTTISSPADHHPTIICSPADRHLLQSSSPANHRLPQSSFPADLPCGPADHRLLKSSSTANHRFIESSSPSDHLILLSAVQQRGRQAPTPYLSLIQLLLMCFKTEVKFPSIHNFNEMHHYKFFISHTAATASTGTRPLLCWGFGFRPQQLLRAMASVTRRTAGEMYRALGLLRSSFFTRHFSSPAAANPAAAAAEAAASNKRKRRKKKNLFEIAQFLPNWGLGYHMAKNHWEGISYQITKINLYKVFSLSLIPRMAGMGRRGEFSTEMACRGDVEASLRLLSLPTTFYAVRKTWKSDKIPNEGQGLPDPNPNNYRWVQGFKLRKLMKHVLVNKYALGFIWLNWTDISYTSYEFGLPAADAPKKISGVHKRGWRYIPNLSKILESTKKPEVQA
ncbi:hypothetical protein ACLOJK_012520 [Asimina triloba]